MNFQTKYTTGKNKNIKELEKKNYNNYEQRKLDNLDSIYANVQKA